MLKSVFTVSIALLALFIAWGCSDDDGCPMCPDDVDTLTVTETVTDTLTDTLVLPQEFPAWVDGYILLNPEFFYCEAYVFANGGENPFIDSLIIADTTFLDMNPGGWYHESDPVFYINVSEDAATPFYSRGETAVITLYGSEMSSTCQVVLLDNDIDAAVIQVPSDGNDVAFYSGEGYTCEWSFIENAEWYGIRLRYTLDSLGNPAYRTIYTYTYDTTFTVADSVDGFPVDHVDLYALPTTGPDPESRVGNWTGDLAGGKLYSISDYASATIYFEVEVPVARLVPAFTVETPGISPQEMIKAVYEAYR